MDATDQCPSCQAEGTYHETESESQMAPWLTVHACTECGFVRAVYYRPPQLSTLDRRALLRRYIDSGADST